MDVRDVIAVVGILVMGASLIYLFWTIRSSVEEERKRISKS